MGVATFFVTLVFGLAVAVPMNSNDVLNSDPRQIARNSVLEQIILDVLEDLREIMINGSDDVPVLDPLTVEEFNLDLDALGLENSHVAVQNAVVNHLSTFVVNDFRFTVTSVLPIQRYTLVLDLSIPELEAEAGTYDLSVSVMGFTLFGIGHMKVRLIEPRVQATVLLRVRALPPPITFVIENSDVVFKLTGFESEMSGMLGGDQMSNDFISLFLKDLVPQLVEFYEAEISNVINQLVLEIGNAILADLDLGSILG